MPDGAIWMAASTPPMRNITSRCAFPRAAGRRRSPKRTTATAAVVPPGVGNRRESAGDLLKSAEWRRRCHADIPITLAAGRCTLINRLVTSHRRRRNARQPSPARHMLTNLRSESLASFSGLLSPFAVRRKKRGKLSSTYHRKGEPSVLGMLPLLIPRRVAHGPKGC